MLNEGVRPAGQDHTMRAEGGVYMRRGPEFKGEMDFSPGPRYPAHKGPEMDTFTRVRCWAAVGFGFFVFFTFLREFLVWSAGSTGKWYGTANLNPFWIRRYAEDWSQGAKKDREAPSEKMAGTKAALIKKKTEEKVKELKTKSDRGTNEFYTKRGVSNACVYEKVASDWMPKIGDKVCISTSGQKAHYLRPATKKGTWMVWILERGQEGEKRVHRQDVTPFDRSLGKCQKTTS